LSLSCVATVPLLKDNTRQDAGRAIYGKTEEKKSASALDCYLRKKFARKNLNLALLHSFIISAENKIAL